MKGLKGLTMFVYRKIGSQYCLLSKQDRLSFSILISIVQLNSIFPSLFSLSLATMKTWKLISYFVAIPGILICTYNTYLKEKEHHEHPRAEFVPYSHLRIRSKVGEQCHFFKLCVKVQWPNDQCTGLWVERSGFKHYGN